MDMDVLGDRREATSKDIYLGDTHREFLPGHVTVLRRLHHVSIYLLNRTVIVKAVTLPALGEEGYDSKHKYVHFASFRNEMAFYRYCVPAMLAPPWEIAAPRPLKLIGLGAKFVMVLTPMAGDFSDKEWTWRMTRP